LACIPIYGDNGRHFCCGPAGFQESASELRLGCEVVIRTPFYGVRISFESFSGVTWKNKHRCVQPLRQFCRERLRGAERNGGSGPMKPCSSYFSMPVFSRSSMIGSQSKASRGFAPVDHRLYQRTAPNGPAPGPSGVQGGVLWMPILIRSVSCELRQALSLQHCEFPIEQEPLICKTW
jgi:hypothetical protein